MTYTRKDLARDLREGRFTSLGSYPKFWLASDGSALSYEAIMSEAREYLRLAGNRKHERHEAGHVIVGCDVNWENPELYCEETNERIPSAYAEPEDESDNT